MKNIVLKLSLTLTAAAMVLFMPAHPASAQAAAAAASTTITGHAQNPLGLPIQGGSVKLSLNPGTDEKGRIYQYTFPVDQQGNFKGTVDKPAIYVAFLIDPKGAIIDYLKNVDIKAGQPVTANFDMMRKEYLDNMTPEEKAQMEAVRKQNQGAMDANKVIANLNNSLKQARDVLKSDPDQAVTLMQQATTAKPDEPILWATLGQAEQYAGDAALAKSKKTSDPDVQQKYQAATDAYKKTIDLENAKKTPNPVDIAASENGIGQIQGKLGNTADSVAAYDAAAKANPAGAYTYFNNEAATFYNANKMDEAAAAADKAIAADPTKPDPYYIKGQSLIGKANVDPATQKITAPPGCVEAYNKYLQLAPTGPHAEEIKGILEGIGATVNNKYVAPGASKKK